MTGRARQTVDPPSPAKGSRKAVDPAKSAFLRTVSHELRTPLNSIIGFSEILSHELYGPIGEPRYKDYAEIIRQSGYKLLGLVNQIVEIVRLQDGAAELDPAPAPLSFAVMDAADSVRDDCAARQVSILVEDGADMPWVVADEKALRTILVNLLQNAVVFSPSGAEVAVSARRLAGEVEITIEDHGDGVDPDDIPRLMQPFEQGEAALTRTSEGAGLGLPIVRLLCEAMEGRFAMDGRPGRGVVARVWLPAAHMGEDGVAAPPPAA
jgi:signal transduction histidine kinase